MSLYIGIRYLLEGEVIVVEIILSLLCETGEQLRRGYRPFCFQVNPHLHLTILHILPIPSLILPTSLPPRRPTPHLTPFRKRLRHSSLLGIALDPLSPLLQLLPELLLLILHHLSHLALNLFEFPILNGDEVPDHLVGL